MSHQNDDRSLFDALPDAAVIVARDTGLILAANVSAEGLYGYPRNALIGLSVATLSAEPVETMNAVRDGVAFVPKRVHRRKDGTTFMAEASASPVEWGVSLALAIVVRDITERVVMEAALRESKALLSNAFHKNPLLMSVADLATARYLEVNDAFCARTGFAREEMLGRTAVELGLLNEQERDLLAQRLFAAPKNTAIELLIHSKSGAPINCRYWGEVVQTAEGLKLFAAAEDVTEHREIAKAREEALSRLEKISSRVPGVVYQYRLRPDGSSCFPFVSAAIREIYRVSPEEVQDDASLVFTRLHPDDFDAVVASIQQSARALTPWRHEYRVKFDDGTVRWLLGSALPEREPDGAVLWHGFITDVTERKNLEARLAQGDRLASMGMLAAGVAHEINNPLAYVLGNLEALASDLPKLIGLVQRLDPRVLAGVGGDAAELLRPGALDAMTEAAQDALEGTVRIRKISQGLGTFARPERVELDSVEINAALEAAAAMAHNEVKYRARLVKDLGDVPDVLASDGKLAQVFLNLLINAAHAIPEGNVEHHRIGLRTWSEGAHVFAEVSDTGHGIPPELLERVFEPFFTTKKVGTGSGLGLAISKNIVTGFGGDLRVESKVGEGTRVIVRLPVSQARPASPAPSPMLARAAPSGRGRILVVDDEEPIRRILERMLGEHEVVTAASGREARALLEKDPAFDVIFCDLMMPDLTGMDLHAWLVTAMPALAPRVIFVSGGAFTPHAVDYLAGVSNVRLEKPIDPVRLRALASERVRAARAVNKAADPATSP